MMSSTKARLFVVLAKKGKDLIPKDLLATYLMNLSASAKEKETVLVSTREISLAKLGLKKSITNSYRILS